MEPISGILFSLFRGSPQHGEWIVACLQGAWTRLVGERLALVCRPVRFEDFVLVIEITDPAWEDALKSMGADLLGRLRETTGNEVRVLSFSVRETE